MQNNTLNQAARRENARALAAILERDIDTATELLDVNIVVTHSVNDTSASMLAEEVVALLTKTVSYASTEVPTKDATIEILIGNTLPRTQTPALYVSGDATSMSVSRSPATSNHFEIAHPILCLLSACYVASAALKLATRDTISIPSPAPLFLDFSQLGLNLNTLDTPISLGKAYLVGAGAIGNGFLWALRHLSVEGELHVVDYDHIEDTNLNRQIWFDEDDIGQLKVERLTEKAKSFFHFLKLVPRDKRLQELPEKNASAWLPKLIVAVDSRRARRSLQLEMPGEVFDASTTDIREIVLHYHKQPARHACLSCIYADDEQETSREKHIAEHLGITPEKVQEQIIDEIAARTIAERFNNKFSDPTALIGIAYDTLFKSLCGEGALKTPEGRQVIAPFAFVSVLAGTLLALEVARRHQLSCQGINDNYWRVSAWHPPIGRRRQLISAQEGCDFC
ncbi:MAG: ThiF family adenylyltransferase, partial [Pseudomonadota bacterium]